LIAPRTIGRHQRRGGDPGCSCWASACDCVAPVLPASLPPSYRPITFCSSKPPSFFFLLFTHLHHNHGFSSKKYSAFHPPFVSSVTASPASRLETMVCLQSGTLAMTNTDKQPVGAVSHPHSRRDKPQPANPTTSQAPSPPLCPTCPRPKP
jgi:hypothetical protein